MLIFRDIPSIESAQPKTFTKWKPTESDNNAIVVDDGGSGTGALAIQQDKNTKRSDDTGRQTALMMPSNHPTGTDYEQASDSGATAEYSSTSATSYLQDSAGADGVREFTQESMALVASVQPSQFTSHISPSQQRRRRSKSNDTNSYADPGVTVEDIDDPTCMVNSEDTDCDESDTSNIVVVGSHNLSQELATTSPGSEATVVTRTSDFNNQLQVDTGANTQLRESVHGTLCLKDLYRCKMCM